MLDSVGAGMLKLANYLGDASKLFESRGGTTNVAPNRAT